MSNSPKETMHSNPWVRLDGLTDEERGILGAYWVLTKRLSRQTGLSPAEEKELRSLEKNFEDILTKARSLTIGLNALEIQPPELEMRSPEEVKLIMRPKI